MRLSILISFFLSLNSFAKSQEFKVYYPKHRLAEELATTARGIIPGATFSTINSNIVISSSPEGIKAAFALFKELDKPSKKFLIRFRSSGQANAQSENLDVSGGVQGGPVKISKPVKSGNTASIGGVAITTEARDGQGSLYSDQSVEVMEGSEANIHWNGQNFLVRPRAAGRGAVQVELRQENGISTSTTLPLKTWRSLGGIAQTSSGKQSEILGKSTQAEKKSKDFQIYIQETK